VLVVDDERAFREAIRDALTEVSGCALAENGDEALKLAEDPAVEAVLLDLRMPGGSGVDVLKELRERRPALQVIVLAEPADQPLVIEALRLGASDYLAKPLHEEELRLAVTRALRATRLATRWDLLRGRLLRLREIFAELDGSSRWPLRWSHRSPACWGRRARRCWSPGASSCKWPRSPERTSPPGICPRSLRPTAWPASPSGLGTCCASRTSSATPAVPGDRDPAATRPAAPCWLRCRWRERPSGCCAWPTRTSDAASAKRTPRCWR
jgi:CheY-like chemotaxis protein